MGKFYSTISFLFIQFLLIFSDKSCGSTQHFLTWKELQEKAIGTNPNIQSAKWELFSSEQLKIKNYFLFTPTITLGSQYNESVSNTVVGGAILSSAASVPTVAKNYQYSFVLTQNLFSGFTHLATYKKSVAQTQFNLKDVDSKKNQTQLDLFNAYIDFLYFKEFQHVAKTLIDRRRENMELVELRYSSGREHKGQLLRAQAFHQESIFDYEMALVSQLTAAKKIQIITNDQTIDPKDYESKENIKDFIFELIKNDEDFKNFDKEKIVKNHPDYKKSLINVEIAQLGVEERKGAFLPQVNLSATQGRNGKIYPPQVSYWNAILSVTFPLPFTTGDIFSFRSAKNLKEKANFLRDNTVNQLSINLVQAFQQLVFWNKRIEVLNSFNQAAVINAQVARARYTTGLLGFENWDIVENELINRRKGLLDGFRSFSLAYAQWVFSKGVQQE